MPKPNTHQKRTKAECCKTGKAHLRGRLGTVYYEVIGDYGVSVNAPGIRFCPWCGVELPPPPIF